MTCKSKYDVGVDEDRPQVYDAGVGLPSSGRPRRVWQSHVGCELSLENIPLLAENLLDLYIHLIHFSRTLQKKKIHRVVVGFFSSFLIRTSKALAVSALGTCVRKITSQVPSGPRRQRRIRIHPTRTPTRVQAGHFPETSRGRSRLISEQLQV